MGGLDLNTAREIPRDQLDRLVNNFPKQVLAHSLRLAVTIYQDFWSPKRESETDVESSEELHLRCK